MQGVNKRTLQAQETKKKICKTSMRLINKYGYENVTVDDICKACQISKGGFYHHFQSKIDIISQVETMLTNSITDAITECVDIGIHEKILVVINSLLSLVEKSGLEFTRQRTKYVVSSHYILETGSNALPVYFRVKLREILQEAIENGEIIQNTPIDTITEVIMKLISGLISDWCIYDGRFSLIDMGWELTHFTINNILHSYEVNEAERPK